MFSKFKTGLFGALGAAALLACSSASAVMSYGNVAPPGVYFGAGNVNGNFTIDTANGVEVGLRTKDRQTGFLHDGSSGVYKVPGNVCVSGCGGAGRAQWNYEFSVNVDLAALGGSSMLDINNFVIELFVDTDPTAATNFTVLNVLTNWFDNQYWDGSAPRRIGVATAGLGEYALQQSANPRFANSGFGYVPGPGLYDMQLFVRTGGANPVTLAGTRMQIEVPVPGSLALTGLALLGLGVVARRRKAA
jgi:hypothetical protein